MKIYYFVILVSVLTLFGCKGRVIKIVDDKGVQNETDSLINRSGLILNRVLDLFKEGKYKESLVLYYENQNDVLVALETSEKIYKFHNELMIPVIYNQYDSVEAYRRIAELHEKDKWYIEMVMTSRGDTINAPGYYYNTLNSLSDAYFRTGEFEKAAESSMKLLKALEMHENRDSLGYANVLYNTAAFLKKIKSDAKAGNLLLKAKKIYEDLGMKDSEEYKNTMRRINEGRTQLIVH